MAGDFPVPEWQGDIPVFVLIVREGQLIIWDPDEKDWIANHQDLMRSAATWHLVTKDPQEIVLSLVVKEGDRPYYKARHFKRGLEDDAPHVAAYGIGKKRIDGHVDQLWYFLDGQICGGDDVNVFGNVKLMQM